LGELKDVLPPTLEKVFTIGEGGKQEGDNIYLQKGGTKKKRVKHGEPPGLGSMLGGWKAEDCFHWGGRVISKSKSQRRKSRLL